MCAARRAASEGVSGADPMHSPPRHIDTTNWFSSACHVTRRSDRDVGNSARTVAPRGGVMSAVDVTHEAWHGTPGP